MKRLRQRPTRTALLGAALLTALTLIVVGGALAAGEGPKTVTAGNLKFTADGGFTPKALSKKKLEPIALRVEGKIATIDGSHPPALKEVIIEGDKNAVVDSKGIPTCKAGQLQARDTKAVEATCGPAIIGSGQTTVEVQFPEQRPVPVTSKLLLVNGGTSGGTTTWYVHAFFSAPVTGAIVTTVKIKKHNHGRFGTLSVASVPKIANGAGSVTSFNLSIDKTVKVKGKSYHPITAKCTDGKLEVNGEAVFADGTKVSAVVVRTCTPKG